jgi:hypothetical protein
VIGASDTNGQSTGSRRSSRRRIALPLVYAQRSINQTAAGKKSCFYDHLYTPLTHFEAARRA